MLSRSLGIALTLGILLGTCSLSAHAQETPTPPPAKGPSGAGGQLAMFVNAMKSSPGCLGVEQARVMGGRIALFGWFDSKKQALTFTNGPICGILKSMMKMTPAEGEALADITDETTPVAVVISFSPTEEKDAPAGLGQAAIEFWKPVSGGFAFKGRFAPDTVIVPGLHYDKGETAPAKEATPAPKPGTDPAPKADIPGMDQLMPSLEKSPGCLGVSATKLESGKLAIFAYFKDKKACTDWYYSTLHQKMMLAMPPPKRKPLEDVKDDNAPVIVIASLTPSAEVTPGVGLPVAQIAVELYTTAKGGFARGGNFLFYKATAPKK